MVRAVLDTNILIDHLNGIEAARAEIARYGQPSISVITWMEVMVGAPQSAEAPTRAFLDRFERIDVDETIAEAAVALRREHRMRLPDAIILATARCRGALLVTRNTKDFDPTEPGVRAPYKL